MRERFLFVRADTHRGRLFLWEEVKLMPKILLSLATISLVSVVAIGATRAYFSDTETSTGNSFTAGTLDLNLDGGNINVVKFTVSNKAPGDSGTGYWAVYNAGSIAGYLDLEGKTVTNLENGCNEPESTSDATCDNPGSGQGELGASMNVDLFIDNDHDGVLEGGDGDTSLYSGTLDGLAGATVADIALASLMTKYISLNWSIPTSVGNIIQSDSVQLDMTFELGQTTGQ
jgi:predicted ribosomally synthesized peptide with SipW-like signal peptide